jgi:hypothetical protein
MIKKALLSSALLVGACDAPNTPPISSRNVQIGGFITTSDGKRLLEKTAVQFLRPDTDSSTTPTIQIDRTTLYQTMVGVGAALTDSSATLIRFFGITLLEDAAHHFNQKVVERGFGRIRYDEAQLDRILILEHRHHLERLAHGKKLRH